MVERDLIKNLIEILSAFTPSTIGSAAALMWLEGNLKRKLGMFITGVAAGHYVGGFVSQQFNIPVEAAMFVMGLFSMSLVDKSFQLIEEVTWIEVLKKLLGGFIK